MLCIACVSPAVHKLNRAALICPAAVAVRPGPMQSCSMPLCTCNGFSITAHHDVVGAPSPAKKDFICLQEVQGLWEGYKETYAKLEPMRQSLALYMQDKSAGHKRKLAELQSEGERLMADAER